MLRPPNPNRSVNGRQLASSLRQMQQSRSRNSALEQLFRLLEDWRAFTLAETNLITCSDWPGLEELQSKKANLQAVIEQAETAWLTLPNVSEAEKSQVKVNLRKIASELVALETHNRELLSEHLAHTDSELKNSSKTISSLRNLQNAYGRSGQSFWQAYS
jgi:hypothetical protein